MAQSKGSPPGLRFGAFEVDLRAGELRKHGLKIKLQDKPFQILATLLESPGQLVRREELRQKLWPADTFVDFDHGLNSAVNKLREALCDSADNPRFVETLARRGYRFTAPVEEIGGATPRPRRSPGPLDSLAVLPFENESADRDIEYLCEGIAESIIYRMAQLPQLRVMAHSAVFRYRRRKVDPQAVGRELNVRAVLNGRVIQRGDDLTIATELVDVANGWQIWGRQYTGKLSDILAVQGEIAAEISQKLHLKLSGEDQNRLVKQHTGNADAYQTYLRGRYYGNLRTEAGLKKGIEYFEQALAKDPDYALAYASLAECYSVLAVYGLLPPREIIPKVKTAATKAVKLDHRLAEAHTSLAVAGLFYDWDWIGAQGEFRQAIDLNPDYALAHYWYGLYLQGQGRKDEALAEIQSARELDPLSLIIRAAEGLLHYFARQYDQAIEKYRQTLEMGPNFYPARCFLGLACEQRGEFPEALAEFQKVLDLAAGSATAMAMLGHTYAALGRKGVARQLLEELRDLSRQLYVPPVRVALIHAALGEKDLAFEWLEKAYEERSYWLLFLGVDPVFDTLRPDSRFLSLLRRMNFPE